VHPRQRQAAPRRRRPPPPEQPPPRAQRQRRRKRRVAEQQQQRRREQLEAQLALLLLPPPARALGVSRGDVGAELGEERRALLVLQLQLLPPLRRLLETSVPNGSKQARKRARGTG